MRTENSLKNAFWTGLTFLINLVVNFVARKIFIDVLGAEYNGLNSLFTSIISILAIAELGIGTTILYSLYKPLHHKDYELIKSLMNFYKKCYRVIAGVVLIIGLLIMPFLPLIVGQVDIDDNIYVVYILFLMNSVFSYLLCYKRTIIVADQKERITKYVHIIVLLLMNGLQIISLYLSKNYYIFLVLGILFTCLENVILAYVANKNYPFIKERAKPLPIDVKSSLVKRIKAMFYHQIGGFVVNGTDNIMISALFGVAQVGLYNNYFLIVSSVLGLISSIFSGVTASVGNLLIQNDMKKKMTTYNGILAISFILAIFVSSVFYVCAQPFMQLWLGGDYLMSELVVCILACYLYFKIMKLPTVAFKNAAGIFYEDRFVPVIESIINILASLICAHLFGISGIIMGTIISTMVLYFGSFPLIVYRKVFNISPIYYYKKHATYLVIAIASVASVSFLTNLCILESPLLELVKNLLITIIIIVFVITLILCKNRDFCIIVKNIKSKVFKRGKNV